jgi:septal ring factor EnvC (AmiA/AmiB activator)
MRKNLNNLEEVEIAFRQITKGIAHIERQLEDVYDQLNQQQGKSRKKNLLTALLNQSNRLVKTIRFGGKQRNTVRQMESLNDLLISSYYQVMLEPRNPKIVKLTRGYLIELKVTAIRWEVLINEILDSHNTRFSMGIKRSSR